MKICRFIYSTEEIRIGIVEDNGTLIDLTPVGITRMHSLLESDVPSSELRQKDLSSLPRLSLADVKLCSPAEQQEVWAAGVTYLRSKTARMAESDLSACAYDQVYDADRPELFFKSLSEKTVAPGEAVGIRKDAQWNVPEPELALVLNSKGRIAGCTVGNDMSSRDIEGENILYLPQAKTYQRSCALGPWITLGATEETTRNWRIRIGIQRAGKSVFNGETSINRMKRSFRDLAEYLFRSQVFPHGAILLTGTGVVPDESFTLQQKDIIRIEITGIGVLENPVMVV